jgi:hypothetical protein
MNMMLHSSVHQAQENPIGKFHHLSPPPYFGVEMGREYGKCGKKNNALKFDYLGRYERYRCSVFTFV